MSAMFAVAWGERAVLLLLRRAGDRTDAAPERDGPIAVSGVRGAGEGDWRCWLSGRLTNAPELEQRFGLPAGADPSALLARACSQLGRDGCGCLRGTFVAVAFDRERETAVVARDHLGGRPLVHARVGGGAVLAEHERAIFELLDSSPAPDRLALAQWIDRGSTPADHTLFERIRRIPPAHRALLCADRVAVEPYWRPRYRGVETGSRMEVAGRLREAAFAAVRRAAEGSRAPGVLLSGGLDSSCVAAGLAARPQPASRARALSGVFPSHPQADERELIEATARHTGLPVELIAFDEHSSILAPALAHIERWSLPPVTPNLFAWEPVMARARALGVDAMLDGEGGDELFGCAPHLIADMLRRGRALAAWRLTARIPGVGGEAGLRVRLRALRLYGIGPLLPAGVRRRRTLKRAVAIPGSLLLHADALAIAALQADALVDGLDGPLWWRGLAHALTQPGETLGASAHLRRQASDERIDRRHPFLFDLDLLESALAAPQSMQFEIRDRALLRDGLTGHIPVAVRTRREKSFFNSLLSAGLATDGALLVEGPAAADAPVREFVSAEALEALLDEGPTPVGARAASRLWRVGLADAWLRAFDGHEKTYELRLRASGRPRAHIG